MDLLGYIPSEKLLRVISDVEALDPGQHIQLQIVDRCILPPQANARMRIDTATNKVLVEISKADFNYNSDNTLESYSELLIAHELFHCWCDRNNIPELNAPASLSSEQTSLAKFVHNLVAHSIVHRKCIAYGFDLSIPSKDFHFTITKSPIIDPPNPKKHLLNALYNTEFYLYYDLLDDTIQYLLSKFPNTHKTTLLISKIIRSHPLDTAQSVRRCMLDLIRFIDKIQKVHPSLASSIILSLVRTEQDLSSPASALIDLRPQKINQQYYIRIYLKSDGIAFTSRTSESDLQQKQHCLQIAEQIKHLSLRDFLELYKIKFALTS